MDKLNELQNNLKYTFNNIELLKTALSHTSYAHENFHSVKSNERLEFLGDTILNLIISEEIYMYEPEINEGNMSKIRSTIICEDSLYEAALRLEYNKFIMLGVGEEKLGGRNKASILSDAFEAVIAAIYLDSDFNTVKDFATNTNISIIYVTHYVEEISSQLDNCLLMKNGQIYKIGKTSEIFTEDNLQMLLNNPVRLSQCGTRRQIEMPAESKIRKLI